MLTENWSTLNLLVVVFFTNLALDTYLHLFLNLLTHPASSCSSLSLPSLTFACFLGPSSLSLPLCLCVNREACLNFLQLRAATPHFDDFAVKAGILRINIWFRTCIICACGGTRERNREKSQCKLSSKIALEKWHHSCGRLEASFLGFLPGKAGQGDKVSGVNHCSVIRLWLCWCQWRLFPLHQATNTSFKKHLCSILILKGSSCFVHPTSPPLLRPGRQNLSPKMRSGDVFSTVSHSAQALVTAPPPLWSAVCHCHAQTNAAPSRGSGNTRACLISHALILSPWKRDVQFPSPLSGHLAGFLKDAWEGLVGGWIPSPSCPVSTSRRSEGNAGNSEPKATMWSKV